MREPRLPSSPVLIARQLDYQARLLLRTPRALFGGVLLPILLLALREAGHHGAAAGGAVAELASLGVVSTAYVTHATGLVAAREAGVLKRWRATPLPPWCWFAARIAATVALAVAGGLATVGAGAALYGLRVDAAGAAGAVAAMALGAVAWAAAGTAASALVPTVEAAWPLLAATYLPVILLSGAVGSVAVPGWLATVVRCLPAEPMIDAARRALSPGSHAVVPLSARDAAVLGGWAVAGVLVAQRRFRWEPRGRHG